MLGRILVTLGGLFVAALFAALLIPYFVDWSDFRRDFEDQASRILGKKVVVHGSVDARLLPFPSVTLNDVRAGSDANGEPLLQAARFSMDAELAPFLSGEARIFDMRIEEPKARIRLLNDGTLEWTRGSQSQFPANSIVLESVKIVGGDIEFIDEQTGRNRHLTDLNMQMSASGLYGPWRADGEATVDGVAGKFTLATGAPDEQNSRLGLRLKIMPQDYPVDFDLDGSLTAREGKPLYGGTFSMLLRKVEGSAVSEGQGLLSNPRTRGTFELSNDRLRVANYRAELGTSDSPYVITGEATLDTGANPEFLLTADGQQIDVGRLISARIQAGKTDRVQKLTVKQRVEALAEIIARIPVPQVPGKATVSLPAIISDDTNIRDIRIEVRPDGKGWEIVNAVATLPGRTQLEASGSLQFTNGAAFDGSLLVASNQPTGLATWLTGEVDPAIRPLSAAGFSSKVLLTPNRQKFEELEIAIGSASMLGRFERQLSEGKSHSIIQLSGNQINIDALRAIASLGLGEPVGSAMLEQSVDAHLKADQLTVGDVVAENVETHFAISGGRINVAQFHAGNVAGAEIKLNGDLSGNLANYKGAAKLEFLARDAGLFADFLASHLPRYALVEKLQRSAPWYQDTNLVVDLSLNSDEGGVNAAISGTINGSRISSVAKLPDFSGITDDTAMEFEAVLKNASTAILLGQAGFDPLPIDADGEGLLSVKLNGTLGNPFETDVSFSTERTRLNLKGEHLLSRDAFGQGQSQLTLESADVSPYLLMNSIPAADIATGLPVKLSSSIKVDQERISFEDLKGNIGGNNFAAKIERRFDAAAPVTGELALDYLDLGWLAENTFGPLSDAVDGSVNENALMAPSFSGLNSRLSLRAKNFAAASYGMMADMTANVETSGGLLSLSDFNANWLGGALSGKISLSSIEGTGVVSGQFGLRGASHLPATWVMADGNARASANYDADLTVESSGKTFAELIQHAAGNGQLSIKGPTLRGFNSTAFQSIVAAGDVIEKDVSADKVQPILDEALWKGETKFSDVVAPIVLSNGLLKLQPTDLTASGALTKVEGEMALEDFALKAKAVLQMDAGAEAMTGAVPNVALNIGGTLFQPVVSPDVTELTGFLGLRAFEKERRRVEALQASIQEKQRLRREAALYAEQQRIREEKAAAERRRIEEQKRLEEERRAEAAQQRDVVVDERLRALGEIKPRVILPKKDSLVPDSERVLRFQLQDVEEP